MIATDREIKELQDQAVKEFAEKLKDLLYIVYGKHGAPLGDLTAEDIACEIDKLYYRSIKNDA